MDKAFLYSGIYNTFIGLLSNLEADPNVVYYHIICFATDPENVRLMGIIEATTIIYHPLLYLITNYQALSFKETLLKTCETVNFVVYDIDSDEHEHYRAADIASFDFTPPELPPGPPPTPKEPVPRSGTEPPLAVPLRNQTSRTGPGRPRTLRSRMSKVFSGSAGGGSEELDIIRNDN